MRNSGAPASPRAALLGRCPALRSSCLLHGVSSYPRGAPGAGRPARDVGVARTARMCVRRGGGRWALRESSLGSNDETRFLVSFWKAGCNADPVRPARDADASGHRAPRGRAGDRRAGPGRSPGPGPAGQMRASLRWAGGSSREAGWPRTHTGQPGGQEQKADGVVTGGAARSRSQALAAALTRRPRGSRTAPQLPAWITHCRGRRQVPPSGL